MGFFESQDDARRKTGLLIALFVLAVLAIIGALYGLLALWMFTRGSVPGLDWLGSISVMVVSLVLFGTGIKSIEMRGGGKVVARGLGGRQVESDTRDPQDRRLWNVVEEMAIASGTPVPAVFVMDGEEGINAFAAGWTPDDAAVAVTKGTLRKLSRDELQGVVAHEFSHILSGDMRLNIRLIGVLHGILILAQLGGTLMRFGGRSGRRSSRDRGPGLGIAAAGFGIWLVGSIGLVLGRVIRAAVSRQREYLADASAVQFTRNPSGLSGALAKLGSPAVGSRVQSPSAEEASHLFFALAVGNWLATHPPLAERIKRIDPSFSGSFPESVPDSNLDDDTGISSLGSRAAHARRSGATLPATPVATLLESVGEPGSDHLEAARRLLADLPDDMRSLAHTTDGARGLVIALLLGTDPERAIRRLTLVDEQASPAVCGVVRAQVEAVTALPLGSRLPVLDLCLPALRRLPLEERRRLIALVVALVREDGQLSVFEWSLVRVLRRHLAAQERPLQRRRRTGVSAAAHVLLSAAAHEGHSDVAEARGAYAAAVAALGVRLPPLLDPARSTIVHVDSAVDVLETTLPKRRQALLRALAASIAHDRRVTAREAEMFRAVAEALDCPVPPLLPGQALC